jgi:hypothetical protein
MRTTQRIGSFSRRPLKKSFGSLFANLVYHNFHIGKNSFSLLGKETEFLLKIVREMNLILVAREARATPHKHWRFLQIAAEKTAKFSESFLMVSLYSEARTFFQENF